MARVTLLLMVESAYLDMQAAAVAAVMVAVQQMVVTVKLTITLLQPQPIVVQAEVAQPVHLLLLVMLVALVVQVTHELLIGVNYGTTLRIY
jgi:hypothetical protein